MALVKKVNHALTTTDVAMCRAPSTILEQETFEARVLTWQRKMEMEKLSIHRGMESLQTFKRVFAEFRLIQISEFVNERTALVKERAELEREKEMIVKQRSDLENAQRTLDVKWADLEKKKKNSWFEILELTPVKNVSSNSQHQQNNPLKPDQRQKNKKIHHIGVQKKKKEDNVVKKKKKEDNVVKKKSKVEKLKRCAESGANNKKKVNNMKPEAKTKPQKTASVCPECHKVFANGKYDMQRHVAHIHRKVMSYQCQICVKGFYRKDNYVQHMRNIHVARNITCLKQHIQT